ncbi:hypothetical protein M441DRAFT_376704 [Trichoderma asperellum CBS 433.97]|uniref:Uncharacterized protein n=1 Tax=Trichoderma asperellum (strain ATCC 204424 / CBS 433.97 / NBRC 101777) TaxID=1042311 RepID=A0A2T3ZFT1_TRIA4|nr:hypothetical protein M441DRAFT_376704 [Trichoderma asperellum CBS 433.97]PTB43664.1 hypothetical protein M441DRAFT_376704 [Trichoderma asperellum CBS 433.97]
MHIQLPTSTSQSNLQDHAHQAVLRQTTKKKKIKQTTILQQSSITRHNALYSSHLLLMLLTLVLIGHPPQASKTAMVLEHGQPRQEAVDHPRHGRDREGHHQRHQRLPPTTAAAATSTPTTTSSAAPAPARTAREIAHIELGRCYTTRTASVSLRLWDTRLGVSQ